METATPRQRMEYCRAFQDVTGNGVVFDWNLVGPRGQRFTLFRESHHTEGDLRAAAAWPRRHRDLVEIQICDVETQETVIRAGDYRGLGLSGFLRHNADLEEWFGNGQLWCDPIGHFAPARVRR